MMMIVVEINNDDDAWEGRHMRGGVVTRCDHHIVKPRIIENQTLDLLIFTLPQLVWYSFLRTG